MNFLKKKDIPLFYAIGDTILGIPEQELGNEFIKEVDRIICVFEPYLQFEVRKLLMLVRNPFVCFITVGKLKKFDKLSKEHQKRFMIKWMSSKLGLLRTGYVTLKAIVGWAFYSLEKAEEEISFPGQTIGREDITPTLLFGKEPHEKFRRKENA